MRRNRIQEQWDSYRREVVPAGAPNIQVTECRRAFYSGAQGLLATIAGMLDPGQEPTAADLRKMAEIDAELREFVDRVEAGTA